MLFSKYKNGYYHGQKTSKNREITLQMEVICVTIKSISIRKHGFGGGRPSMSQLQQIELTLPKHLYSEIKHLSEQEKNSFFHKVVQEQIYKQKKQYMRNQMKEGYLEMAQLNIEICREFAFVEEEALCIGERTIYSNK